MPRLAVALALTLTAVPNTHAQVNIEQQRSLEQGQRVTLDAGFALSAGNSDLYEVTGGLRYDRRNDRTYVLGMGSIRYGENNGTTFRNKSFGHLRLTQTIAKRVALEAFVQLERDGFTLLELRSLAGGGARLHPIDSDVADVYYGTALMVENERLDDTKVVVHPANATVGRWSNYLTIAWDVTENVRLSTAAYIQPQVDHFRDTRILLDASLLVSVTERTSLTTTIDYRHDSRPPDNIESHDLSVRNGIRVRL